MKYDDQIDIAIGMSVNSKIWKNKKILWSELVQRLSEEHKTLETYKEYISASKDEQTKIKDVGGYVGGYLRNGRRKPQNVVHRQLMTLDIDFAYLDFWEDFCLQFNNAALIHSTHKHHESSPRYRLILPMSRECTADEYAAVSRRLAGYIDIEHFDNSTFETNRLMFWPSNPKDIEYYFQFQDGPWIDVDDLLNSYTDWTDSSLWPTAEKQFQRIKDFANRQEDPETKRGIVGAFCRTYSIEEAIEKFLPETYIKAQDDRYSYSKGTTASGLVIYDGKFAYSHHGTDPCGGKLCNAFDLVRIHLYGHLDDEGKSGKNTKSYQKMDDLSKKDKAIKRIIASENLEESKYDFAEDLEITEEQANWMEELEIDSKGKYLSTASNINLIFRNDIRLAGLFKYNVFDNKRYIFGNMPWRKIPDPEPIKNVDYSGVRNYVETIYGIASSLKIDDSLALEFEKHSYHPIRDYLRSLKWDGKERLDLLLIEYFGADDNSYSREAIRKSLVGAVARVFNPGIKFDLVLTLIGEQGTGKSTFLKKLGGPWFSDTFMTVHGKEALEQIQGAWLIEMAELSGLKKAEVESIKHFISKQEDSFRPAYARSPETYFRQCIFFGTTNKRDFLTDPSGNRRFIPVDVNEHRIKKSIWDDLTQEEIDQIWAEAYHKFKKKETLYMSSDANKIANIEQKKHSETDERRGLVEDYLNKKLPEFWDDMDLFERRSYLEGDELNEKPTVERDYVCVAEIWCECLGKEKQDMDRYKTRAINDILKSLDDWEQSKSTKNFKLYGKQKYYSRKLY